MKENRKSQSEIVGFVMIVIIVAILAVFFLGITVRKPVQRLESKEIENFLISLKMRTSSCALTFEPQYLTLGELIKVCYVDENDVCLSGEKVCNEMKKEVTEIMEKNWRDYNFEIYYEEGEFEENIISLRTGNCTNFVSGKEFIKQREGNLVIELKTCI